MLNQPAILPQLCTPAAVPPSGPDWVHEVKHDGHRILAFLDGGSVRLRTRPGNDATRRFAPIAAALSRLKVRSAVLDGEVAVPDERGVTHISLLDEALKFDPSRLATTPSISCSWMASTFGAVASVTARQRCLRSWRGRAGGSC